MLCGILTDILTSFEEWLMTFIHNSEEQQTKKWAGFWHNTDELKNFKILNPKFVPMTDSFAKQWGGSLG